MTINPNNPFLLIVMIIICLIYTTGSTISQAYGTTTEQSRCIKLGGVYVGQSGSSACLDKSVVLKERQTHAEFIASLQQSHGVRR